MNPHVLRSLFGAASAPGRGRALSTLIFHRVHPVKDELFPGEMDASRFDALCARLRATAHVLPLPEAIARAREGTLPSRAAAITFDDGYLDNVTVALPILQAHGLNATFFVATGFLDGSTMWNDRIIEAVRQTSRPGLEISGLDGVRYELRSVGDRRAAVLDLIRRVKHRAPAERAALVERIVEACRTGTSPSLMMRPDDVQALHRAGMHVGAHTVSHPILASLDAVTAAREIGASKAELQDLLGAPVDLFAYPNGQPGTDYTAEHVEIVRRLGFRAAVTTSWGAAARGCSPFEVPRFTPWDLSPAMFMLRLAANTWKRAQVLDPQATSV